MLDKYKPFIGDRRLEMILGVLFFIAGTLLFNDSLRGKDDPLWAKPFNWM